MDELEIVVATDAKGGIGKSGTLPWHLPADLKFFSELTTKTSGAGRKNVVIMGRKTWESIPSRFRPLPGRVNLVLSANKNLRLPVGVLRAGSFDEAMGILGKKPLVDLAERAFVIGGAQIYQEALKRPECRTIHLTQILESFDCDAFFPPYHAEFERVSASKPFKSGELTFFFCEYRRRK